MRGVAYTEVSSVPGKLDSLEHRLQGLNALGALLSQGRRQRIRTTKRTKKGKSTASDDEDDEMTDRGWVQLRDIMEQYFVDDLYHLFGDNASEPLYCEMDDIVENMTQGLRYIQEISNICELSLFTRHVPVIAVMVLVIFHADVLVSGNDVRGVSGELLEPQVLGAYLADFCKTGYFGLTDGCAVVCYKDGMIEVDEMDTTEFCVAHVGHIFVDQQSVKVPE